MKGRKSLRLSYFDDHLAHRVRLGLIRAWDRLPQSQQAKLLLYAAAQGDLEAFVSALAYLRKLTQRFERVRADRAAREASATSERTRPS